MTSATETAIAGLVSSLTAIAGDDTLPAPSRNLTVAAIVQPFGASGVKAAMNIWDGAGEADENMALLGADIDRTAKRFQITQRPLIEWLVEGGSDADRDIVFDRGLEAIDDLFFGDRTLGGALGDEGYATIELIERAGSGLVTDGVPGVRSCVITPRLVFSSNRPF